MDFTHAPSSMRIVKTTIFISLALMLLMCLKHIVIGRSAQNNIFVHSVRASAPDLFIDLEELLAGWGYPLESHTARTEDGYLLTVHRIPHGRRHNASRAAAPPVLLQHGMVSSSEQWVLGGPDVAPALILADRGYDVWMPNARGTNYSLRHETMGSREPRFWNFTWHEMGVYDVPAAIDYVLSHTQHERLFFVGHSMGTLLGCVALSLRPEYNAKVRLQVGLGPAIFGVADTKGVIAQVAMTNQEFIKATMMFLAAHMPTYEILPRSDSLATLVHMFCGDTATFNKLCAVGYSLFMGSMDLQNTTGLSRILTRGFSSTSILVLLHYWQVVTSGSFRQNDLGVADNLRVYGAPEPPEYPMEQVTAPTALYGAEADILVTVEGVMKLAKALPNVVSTLIIKDKFFNHMSFVHHPHTYDLLMSHVLQLMEGF